LLLLQVNTHLDPEDSGRYTIKRYRSEKKRASDGQEWEHQEIVLEPLNPVFKAISLSVQEVRQVKIVGELVSLI
jgi:SOS-response transcriptional repressor LexA